MTLDLSSKHRDHFPTLFEKCRLRDVISVGWTNGFTSLSMDGVAKEGRPKFNPQLGWELNPGPPGWQSEMLPTALTLHTHTITSPTL